MANVAGIRMVLSCPPLGEATVVELHGREAMDSLSRWDVRLRTAAEADVAALARARATLTLIDEEEGSERSIDLLVVRAAVARQRDGAFECRLRLSDPPWILTQRRGYRLVLEKTSEGVATEVLEVGGVTAPNLLPRTSGKYAVRLQTIQYDETDWAFVERLLAEDGISYWFDLGDDGAYRLVLGDSPGAHDGIEGKTALPFRGGHGTGSRSLLDLEWDEQVTFEQAIVRDFDVRQPDVPIQGEAGNGGLGWFEYPANLTDPKVAGDRAERRLQQLQRDRIRLLARTHCVRLQPGRVFDVFGAGAMFDQRVLVSELEHRFDPRGGEGLHYLCNAVLRPTKDAAGAERPTHRPAIASIPRLSHVETAVTTGASGEEIHVDDLGRVKLRFFWDRSGITDDKSSTWIRCLQYPLGASMFLPRVGWEVAVGYLDGLPERPFVLGRLYNATAVVPYALPGASATTAFQSKTSPGGGGTNEIKMADDAGSEQFYVHAARDMSLKVGGTHKTKVGGNEVHSVGLNLVKTVHGTETATVGGKQEVAVEKEIFVEVAGSNTEVIVAAELINCDANRAIDAGSAYLELIGAAYGIQCNQSNTKTTGAFTRVVLGNKALVALVGFGESVAGMRIYVCRGARTYDLHGSYSESIIGGKLADAGRVDETAAKDASVVASFGTVESKSATLKSGAKVSIMAKTVTIDVGGPLLAETLDLSGGKLKTKGGVTEVKGDATREAGGEVG